MEMRNWPVNKLTSQTALIPKNAIALSPHAMAGMGPRAQVMASMDAKQVSERQFQRSQLFDKGDAAVYRQAWVGPILVES